MTNAALIGCGFLLLGVWLRANVRWLAAVHAPAALVAGLIALLVAQLLPRDAGSATAVLFDGALQEWQAWRSPLVPIIFAGMLLVKPAHRPASQVRATTQQAVAAWILILGQLILGLLATWLLLAPMFGVPIHFGQLLEVSWAGGFGSSAYWGEVHRSLGTYPSAGDLAIFLTTSGLLYGVFSGVILANIAIRRKWTAQAAVSTRPTELVPPSTASTEDLPAHASIDPLMLQILLLAAAFAVGVILQWAAGHALQLLPGQSRLKSLSGDLPLFVFTLLGGFAVRRTLTAFGQDGIIHNETMHRLTGVALELLIFVAIATLQVSVIRESLLPAMLLMLLGAAWVCFNVVWVSPRILPPDCWFELAIMNHGFATATTAQGMMLLRIVDPTLRTDAARIYAQAAPLTAMFIGGGLITMLLPDILTRLHPLYIIVPLSLATVALFCIGIRLRRTLRAGS